MSNKLIFDFYKKKILIVGGSGGFGSSLIKNLIKFNAEIYYISKKKLNEKKANHIYADLSNISSLKPVLKKIKNLKIDILINCAAINFAKKHYDISIKEWDKVLNVNLTSAFLLCNSVLHNMKKNKYGKIVNVSSIAGRHRSIVSGIHYVTSKAALIGFTKQLSYEVGKYGINVNAVCPSQTKTKMYLNTITKKKEREIIKGIPLNRIANVEDQIYPILFLCSDEASYMTGAIIDVNGGQI